MKKRALLLDTNFSAKPIYDYLLKTGLDVYVVGGNPNDALAKSIEKYINLDYSDIAKVKLLIKELKIDFLVPGGNDFSYKVCSAINEEIPFYNIDPEKVNDIINIKEIFRQYAADLGLHVPRTVRKEQLKDFLPVIVKPADAYSGHGMTVIQEADENKLKDAIVLAKSFSKTERYLIEEYVQGQLYSHSAFIIDGKIDIDFIVEEHCVVNPYVVDTSRVVFDFDKNMLSQIRGEIIALTKKLNLHYGLIHTQFISNGSSFWLIEVTRRCPGDLYSMLIEYSTGFPYAEYYARPFICETKKVLDFKLDKKLVMRHTITLDKASVFNYMSFNYPIKIINNVPLSLTGDRIKESPFSRIGILFCLSGTEDESSDIFCKTIDRTLYSINNTSV